MNTTITIKLDKKLKSAAKRTADRLGIPLTTVVNAQLEEFVRSERFEVSLKPRPEKVAQWEALRREYDEHPERFVTSSAEDFIKRLKAS